MQIGVLAVGRLRAGPERELVDDYLTRAGRSARSLGLTGFAVTEVEDRKGGGKAAEASLLRRALPPGGVSVALDERGCTLTSPQFAGRLDRKSTRLNSSHTVISYAVFCLKKKKSSSYFFQHHT